MIKIVLCQHTQIEIKRTLSKVLPGAIIGFTKQGLRTVWTHWLLFIYRAQIKLDRRQLWTTLPQNQNSLGPQNKKSSFSSGPF